MDTIPAVLDRVVARFGDREGLVDGSRRLTFAELALEVDGVAAAPDDLSDLIFTSGTTGAPKGAMLTHGACVWAYTTWAGISRLCETDRYLIINPFFHVFGAKAGILACVITGATILPHAVFDVD